MPRKLDYAAGRTIHAMFKCMFIDCTLVESHSVKLQSNDCGHGVVTIVKPQECQWQQHAGTHNIIVTRQKPMLCKATQGLDSVSLSSKYYGTAQFKL